MELYAKGSILRFMLKLFLQVSSTPVRGQQVKRSRSLSPRRPQRFKADGPSNTDRDCPEITPSEDVDKRDQDVNGRKIADLRKLLKLKVIRPC